MRKTQSALYADLTRSIENLQGIAASYDLGFANTSLSMAVAIRALLHQTNTSSALIKQLCDVDGLDFNSFQMVTTMAEYKPAKGVELFSQCLICMFISTEGCRYMPIFGNLGERKIRIEDWWNEQVLRDVSSGYDSSIWYTRKDLILQHANKEGGAHFDSSNSKISHLGSPAALGWEIVDDSPENQYNQKNATIRQISYEVLRSLFSHYALLFTKS